MTTYYNTGSLPFMAVQKVKPLTRYLVDGVWFVKARVTSRRKTITGRRTGEIVSARPECLYRTQFVQRGTNGRLGWIGVMTDAEFLNLPLEQS